MVDHPGVARVSCRDCQRFVYDLKTGEVETYASGSLDNVIPQRRVGDPPCKLGFNCPKVGPEQEREHVLSRANSETLQSWLELRATPAAIRSDATADGLTRAAYSVIHQAFRARDRADAAAMLGVLT